MEAARYDPADPQRRPGWYGNITVLQWLSPLPGGSVVKVEPGSGIELYGQLSDAGVFAIDGTKYDQAALWSAFAGADLELVFLGANSLQPAESVNPGVR